MRCPILPVGDAVTFFIQAVPQAVTDALRQALTQQGYPDPGPGAYGPAMAQVLYRWQLDHPDAAKADAVVAQVAAITRLPGIASCATFSALGLACEEAYWDPLIWGPIIGDQAATTASYFIAQAQRSGLINLRCAPPPAPAPSPSSAPSQKADWLPWAVALGAIWYLSQRRRSR